MAASSSRDLFLQVGGTVAPLQAALKIGAGALLEFNGSVTDTVAEVNRRFEEMGSNPAPARSLVSNFRNAFSEIQQQAKDALALPTSKSGSLSLDVKSATAAASAATAQATALREIADAATRAAQASGAENEQLRLFAIAATASAAQSEQYAAAMRQQAETVELVQGELAAAGATAVKTADVVSGAHGRMSASSMIMQHVVRSTVDSFSAGLPITMIFGEQIARLGEAAALSAQSGENAGGAFAKFGAFMAGPWGLALTAAVAVLSPLVAKLFEADDALKLAKIGNDGLSDAQGVLGKMFDLTSGKLKHQNDLLRLNAQLTAINLRAEAAKERTDSTKTFTAAGQPSLVTRFMDSLALDGPSGGTSLSRIRDTRDANVARMRDIVTRVQSGALSSTDALKLSETQDFTGTKVDAPAFRQAIIDAAAAVVKDATAAEIEASLKNGVLDPALRQDGRQKKPKSTLAEDDQMAAARAKLATATTDVEVAEAQLDIIRANRKNLTPQEYENELIGAEQALSLVKMVQQTKEQLAKFISQNSKAIDQGFEASDKDTLDAIHGADTDRFNNSQKGVQSPLFQYRAQLTDATGDMNKAMQNVEVDGLKGLEDGLVGIITGTKSVAQAFKEMATSIIADIAKIAIEKAIVSFIPGLGKADGGLISPLKRAGGGIIPAFANGGANGLFAGIGGPRDDKNLVWLSNGEFVTNAASTKRFFPLLKAINDNSLPAFADGGLNGMSSGISLRSLTAADVRAASQPAITVHMGGTQLNAPGADPAQLARLEAAFNQSQRELPARVVSAVTDAKSRLMMRGN